ncbi:MAG: DEAD/DEAH box helicase [Hydrogenophaga sp.]|uniref:DEAD/DEAH box helicase n=1 Tax=Hydrogenophaga sp. TaxID=1904254 RepID=UPI001BBE050A|nr:DEAD/DEAH box helicase [Hydrogenophaga sp.]MBS3912411.1 DEAD/DEAH box helicase [Hydrogenophaga sp.]MDO9133261.1 DEAD/DEAH box helicase [Hydrogenophaga sp.]MDO9606092.1 DEAD/DEAH box helicase [Hydrogenophaga sp.]MDP2164827.1 DEAD/DEAH box helicase [Hydrogenophaga sp.]MDP3477421.1 DEAD/DEAH box helicase [Hydrogenophaga sp.]
MNDSLDFSDNTRDEFSPAQDAFIAEVADVAVEADPETGAVANAAPVVTEPNGFELLGLAPELVQACVDLGYTKPTQVQNNVVPKAMLAEGEARFADLMVSSQTGSGKTAAFLLPVLHTLLQQQAQAEAQERADFDRSVAEALARGEVAPKRPKRKDPTSARNFKAATPGALILCPTRELAQQVAQDAIDLVRHCRGLRIANVVGGMPYQVQIARLQNADLVVATPGRLLDLQRSQQIKLDKVQFLVVDEADRMLDLGFSDDLADVNDMTSQRRQTMMFSATFAPRIQQLAMRVMHDGGKHVQKIQIDSPQEQHVNIQQKLFWADNAQHKRTLLDHWLRDTTINQAIVFCSTQIECDGLATDLQQSGFAAVALHGALSQGIRNRRLMALRDGQVQILVATDVAARGIDVPTITHVFNFGLPMKAEDYTHRIGRTGRAGRDGQAITFAEMRDRRKIFDIEAFTRQRIAVETIPGMEPRQRAPSAEPFGRGGAPGGRPVGRGNSNDRFADRRGAPAPRGPRFEGRGDAPRFEGRSDAPRFEGRGEAPRFEGNRFEREAPRSENRFDNRGDSRPAGRGFGDKPPARAGFGAKPAGFSSFARPDTRGGDRFSDRGNSERAAMRGGEFAPRRPEGGAPARPVARRSPR